MNYNYLSIGRKVWAQNVFHIGGICHVDIAPSMEYSEAFEPASVVRQIVVGSVKLEEKVEGEAYNRGISLRLP